MGLSRLVHLLACLMSPVYRVQQLANTSMHGRNFEKWSRPECSRCFDRSTVAMHVSGGRSCISVTSVVLQVLGLHNVQEMGQPLEEAGKNRPFPICSITKSPGAMACSSRWVEAESCISQITAASSIHRRAMDTTAAAAAVRSSDAA